MFPISAGHATIAGVNLSTLNLSNIYNYRRQVGMIFQDFKLFADWTIYENLNFALKATDWSDPNERIERIRFVLSQLDMDDSGSMQVRYLSGGEQQKVAIARTLLNEPKVILADEPTGNLDAENADSIIQILYKLSQEIPATILLTTHHQFLIERYPARVIRNNNGVFEG